MISPSGPDNEADQSMMMATQMTAPGAPPDMKKAYKEEWEALEVNFIFLIFIYFSNFYLFSSFLFIFLIFTDF